MYSKEDQVKDNRQKKFASRKCASCRKWFTREEKDQITCSVDCAIAYIPVQRAKKKRKAKKDFNDNDKKHLMEVAQKTFNKYIRERDKNDPCISCRYEGNGRQWHAGHYMPVGSNGHIRFDEDNCHKQCQICNTRKSGNLVQYKKYLILKIGAKDSARLKKKFVKIWTVEELKEIISIYKTKLKELQCTT